jgi:hypothetical protein
MVTQLIGERAGTGDAVIGNSHWYIWQFTCTTSGTVTQFGAKFKWLSDRHPTIRFGLFADGSGYVGAGANLLCSETWIIPDNYDDEKILAAIGTADVVLGTKYWLGCLAENDFTRIYREADVIQGWQYSAGAPYSACVDFSGVGDTERDYTPYIWADGNLPAETRNVLGTAVPFLLRTVI